MRTSALTELTLLTLNAVTSTVLIIGVVFSSKQKRRGPQLELPLRFRDTGGRGDPALVDTRRFSVNPRIGT